MSNTEFVATFIAADHHALASDLLINICEQFEKSGASALRIQWLEKSRAADIFCQNITIDNLRLLIAGILQDQPIDFIVQPAPSRRKKLLIADMESTIIEQEMLDELAEMVDRRTEVAAITHRAMNGEIDFPGALRARVALLKGQPVSILEEAAKRITATPGAETLIATMKKTGATCWLVSGGFTYFVDPVAKKFGFDKAFSNTLVLKDGVITGEVAEPILDKDSKKILLEKACAELDLPLSEALTVGDGANDVPMLAACNQGGGMGIAYQAKPKVRAAVANQVNWGDLSVLLYAQGYGSTEGG